MSTSEASSAGVENFIITLSCPNKPGIVAAVSRFLFESGHDIRSSHQLDEGERFFIRLVFAPLSGSFDRKKFTTDFDTIAHDFGMVWTFRSNHVRKRVVIMVSAQDHCLADILYRHHTGEMDMDIAAIISNHPRTTYSHLEFGKIPFHHLPVSKETKAAQEKRIAEIIDMSKVDLVVLARYMQILSPALTEKLAGRCINIHHSFLPGFKGAKPYHQAFERGVKLIGATAHFVTSDLDEGPIIEQDVERISHSDTVETLVRKGRDIERRVLARAVRYFLDDRILLNGRKTVVFTD